MFLKAVTLLVECICVVLFSVVFATGLGFVQGAIVFQMPHADARFMMREDAAVIGGFVGGILVPIMYYATIRNRRTLAQGIAMCAIVIAVGAGSAWGMSMHTDMGWVSMFMTILATIGTPFLFDTGCDESEPVS